MAKKNNVQIEEPAQAPGPEDGYVTTLWAGCKQYQCKKCAFDTLDLDVMLEHLLFHPAVTEMKLEEPARPTPNSASNPGEEKQDIYEIDLSEGGSTWLEQL